MDGVGAFKLSFKMDFKVFLWKIIRGSIELSCSENVFNPDFRTGLMNVLNMLNMINALNP